jgi:hypothetical protein
MAFNVFMRAVFVTATKAAEMVLMKNQQCAKVRTIFITWRIPALKKITVMKNTVAN